LSGSTRPTGQARFVANGARRSEDPPKNPDQGSSHAVDAAFSLASRLIQMNEATSWLTAIADASYDAIIGRDLNGLVTSWNKAAETMFGFTATEIIGQAMTQLIPHDRIDEEASILRRIDRNQKVELFETSRQHKSGTIVPVSLTVSPVHDDQGSIIGVSSVVRDRTAIEERERQLQAANRELEGLALHLSEALDKADRATRAKSRFLSGVSQELRTPLNGVLGYTQLLHVEGGLSPTQDARVNAMLEAGEHLLELITCVLDLSQVEAENFEPQAVEIDVQTVAAACLELVRWSAEAKGLELHLSMAPDTPEKLVTDPVRLRQVLFNLLGNAIKSTLWGTVELRLRTVSGGAALRIEVVEPGLEIPSEQSLEADRPDTRVVHGANDDGVDLALSAQLANSIGGRLGRQDSLNGGRLFWLELPLNSLALTPTFVTEPADEQPAQAPALHVLVVDDIAMNRDIAASMLRTAGHTVVCLEGGAEAVEAVATTDFDVVLMDVRMPEMDGLEATRRIRALAGSRGRVPVVALTALAFAEQVGECYSAGMDGHVSKPFNIDTLAAAVMGAALRQRPQDQDASPASMPSAMIFPSVNPVIGADLPLLDAKIYERNAFVPSITTVASYLQTISALGEALLLRLHEPNSLTRARDELAEAARTMAESAGVFGFERLTIVAREFERAIQSDTAEAPALAEGLSAALEATIEEVDSRRAALVEA
jgi:PAS domain S-box-containing protein